MGWEKEYKQIKEKQIGQTGKKAILIEGDNDKSLFRIFLSKKFNGDWEKSWVLGTAGSKLLWICWGRNPVGWESLIVMNGLRMTLR